MIYTLYTTCTVITNKYASCVQERPSGTDVQEPSRNKAIQPGRPLLEELLFRASGFRLSLSVPCHPQASPYAMAGWNIRQCTNAEPPSLFEPTQQDTKLRALGLGFGVFRLAQVHKAGTASRKRSTLPTTENPQQASIQAYPTR